MVAGIPPVIAVADARAIAIIYAGAPCAGRRTLHPDGDTPAIIGVVIGRALPALISKPSSPCGVGAGAAPRESLRAVSMTIAGSALWARAAVAGRTKKARRACITGGATPSEVALTAGCGAVAHASSVGAALRRAGDSGLNAASVHFFISLRALGAIICRPIPAAATGAVARFAIRAGTVIVAGGGGAAGTGLTRRSPIPWRAFITGGARKASVARALPTPFKASRTIPLTITGVQGAAGALRGAACAKIAISALVARLSLGACPPP